MSNEIVRNEYVSRINKVLDYIEENIDRQFTLEELAGVASFSQFHFQLAALTSFFLRNS